MSDSQQVTDAQVDWSSDEAVCRAYDPDARYVWKGLSRRWSLYVGKSTYGGTDIAYMWSIARKHPDVMAYEALHRPKAVAQALDRGFTPASPEDRAAISDLMREIEEHNGMREPVAQPFISRLMPLEQSAKPVPPASGFEEWFMRSDVGGDKLSPDVYCIVRHIAQNTWNALSTHPPAPVDAKVQYRIDFFYPDTGLWNTGSMRSSMETVESAVELGYKCGYETARIVKITTTEEVIETRKKE